MRSQRDKIHDETVNWIVLRMQHTNSNELCKNYSRTPTINQQKTSKSNARLERRLDGMLIVLDFTGM